VKFKYSVRYALAAIAFALVTSCGGGGAKTNPALGGTLQLLPTAATFYAGVVYTISVQGGKPPYIFTSSEPSLLPLPAETNSNTFQVVGANPSTIDAGLPANALPVKTVNLTVRDSSGQVATSTIQVGRNFLTGYQLNFTATTCTTSTGAAAATITPCAGGDTTAEVFSDFAGNLVGDAQFTFDVVTGTMGFVNPIGSNTVTQSFTTTSDHQGNVLAIIRVPAGTPTQIGVIRVTHVASGVSTNYAFTIIGAVTGPLAAVPSTFTFTGANSSICGSGAGSFLVTGGSPPYSATSSNPNISVTATDPAAGRFTINVGPSSPPCASGSIVVTDSGNHTPVSVTVTTTAGSAAAPTPLAVTPTSTGTITCGSSASVVATGGSGTYQAASSGSGVSATVAGNIITITSNSPGVPAGNANGDRTVTVTDGASNVTVSVPHCT
jgi:hypothetical protein